MGSGGVGGYFGAKLLRGGAQVTMVARGPHLDAIRRFGLAIRSAVEGDSVVRPAAVCSSGGAPVSHERKWGRGAVFNSHWYRTCWPSERVTVRVGKKLGNVPQADDLTCLAVTPGESGQPGGA